MTLPYLPLLTAPRPRSRPPRMLRLLTPLGWGVLAVSATCGTAATPFVLAATTSLPAPLHVLAALAGGVAVAAAAFLALAAWIGGRGR